MNIWFFFKIFFVYLQIQLWKVYLKMQKVQPFKSTYQGRSGNYGISNEKILNHLRSDQIGDISSRSVKQCREDQRELVMVSSIRSHTVHFQIIVFAVNAKIFFGLIYIYIYCLQARCISDVKADTDHTSFLAGTLSLKEENEVHLLRCLYLPRLILLWTFLFLGEYVWIVQFWIIIFDDFSGALD